MLPCAPGTLPLKQPLRGTIPHYGTIKLSRTSWRGTTRLAIHASANPRPLEQFWSNYE